MTDAIRYQPWLKKTLPRKILVMRFQAMGDVVITLPYLQSLKEKNAELKIHLLTRQEVSEIPRGLKLFNKVFAIGGGRNAKIQFVLCMLMLPLLWLERYDAVIDLQNHRISKILRRLLNASAWSEFDRSSKILAGERTRVTIDALNIGKAKIATGLQLRMPSKIEGKLKSTGWTGQPLLVLNPAGAFESRSWPLENYVAFSRHWLTRDPNAKFLILGLNSLRPKADFLKEKLGEHLIDLTGQTSPLESFVLLRLSTLVLSEDSGLMHMAWVQGIPTLALFGSSPSYWSSPLGSWSKCLNSSDLPCGDCFQKACKFNDVHCLTRWTPEKVFAEAEDLLASIANRQPKQS